MIFLSFTNRVMRIEEHMHFLATQFMLKYRLLLCQFHWTSWSLMRLCRMILTLKAYLTHYRPILLHHLHFLLLMGNSSSRIGLLFLTVAPFGKNYWKRRMFLLMEVMEDFSRHSNFFLLLRFGHI